MCVQLQKGLAEIGKIGPSGSNGGEAACLRMLLKMNPDAIYFLGDGGWSKEALLEAASAAKSKNIKIHSIAFFIESGDGGLEAMATLTEGQFHRIDSADDLDTTAELTRTRT